MLYCLVLWVWCKMICIRQDFFHFFETRRCTVPAWPGGTAYCYVGEKSPTAVAGSWSNGVVAPFPKTYKAFSQSWNSFRNCCRSANGTTSDLMERKSLELLMTSCSLTELREGNETLCWRTCLDTVQQAGWWFPCSETIPEAFGCRSTVMVPETWQVEQPEALSELMWLVAFH